MPNKLDRLPFEDPDGSAEAMEAYLFECELGDLCAVSIDPSGSNLPTAECPGGWHFKGAFALGVREPLPVRADPETVITALLNHRYYIWRESPLTPESSPEG